jgi:hypothetical protein
MIMILYCTTCYLCLQSLFMQKDTLINVNNTVSQKWVGKIEQYTVISSLYVCMAIKLFVETPRKYITAKR